MAGDEPQDIAPITLPKAHGMECSLKYLRKFAIDKILRRKKGNRKEASFGSTFVFVLSRSHGYKCFLKLNVTFPTYSKHQTRFLMLT
jgi:hypothetical protein